jgi:hypothetical protein
MAVYVLLKAFTKNVCNSASIKITHSQEFQIILDFLRLSLFYKIAYNTIFLICWSLKGFV